MGAKSGIEWTDATWNPTTGCDKISPGCDNCYALRDAKRLKAAGIAAYQTDGEPLRSGPGFGFAMHADRLDQPIRWQRPRRIFVNSMSDLFHEGMEKIFVEAIFDVMEQSPRHKFQLLTKRHRRMSKLFRIDGAPVRNSGALGRFEENPFPNVWLGVSVENQQWADTRIPWLLKTPAAVRWLSMEPLLGPVDLSPWISDLDWVVTGGESGSGFREIKPEWARDLRDQCVAAGVPFHFKQWSGYRPKKLGRELDGRTWDEFPA